MTMGTKCLETASSRRAPSCAFGRSAAASTPCDSSSCWPARWLFNIGRHRLWPRGRNRFGPSRTMPMLLFGAFSGVVTELVSRKHVLQIGQLLTPLRGPSIFSSPRWRFWALCGRGIWRFRRFCLGYGVVDRNGNPPAHGGGERGTGHLVSPGAGTRYDVRNSGACLVGPIRAGLIYQHFGIAVYLCGCLPGSMPWRAPGSPAACDIISRTAEGSWLPRCHATSPKGWYSRAANITIAGVLAVTIAMNLLAFPYSALVAPIGRQVFLVSPTLVGDLGRRGSVGRLVGGLWLTSGEPPLTGRTLMVGGSLMFLSACYDASCTGFLAGLWGCWSSEASVPPRLPTCRPP